MTATTPDVLVVGGGVIGCAIARELSGGGRRVVLVDRGPLGGESSTAASGVLSVASGTETDGPRLSLRRAGLDRYPALSAALLAETGIDVGLEPSGVVELCLSAAEVAPAQAKRAARAAAGFRVEWWDRTRLRAEEPQVADAAVGALASLDDCQVDCVRLVDAYAAAARRRGAELWPGVEVSSVEWHGDRIVRVHAGGSAIEPGTVVFAAGAWTPAVSGVALPIAPVRGQMLALRARPLPCRHVLYHAGGAIAPKRYGELWIGGTVDDAGFTRAVTLDGIAELRRDLERMLPSATGLPLARAWYGLRPGAPDGGPLIGWIGANALCAGGHHRNGILLAPITAELIAGLVDGRTAALDLSPFAPV